MLVEQCVRNPVKVAVGVILLALFGTVSLLRMPMQLTPEVQTPAITIETVWPGASPQEVEREIVQEQEEQLKGVEGVRKLSSECMDSQGKVTLEFLVGTDMSEALLKVNSRLQQVADYPEDAREPVLSTSNSADNPISWLILSARVADADAIRAFQQEHPSAAAAVEKARDTPSDGLRLMRLKRAAAAHPEVAALLPDGIDVTEFRRLAEDVIEARLERVPGVSNSNVIGGREDELQLIVDPDRLAARRLTIADVRAALRGRNKDTSGGDFQEGKRRYVVRTLGQFRSPEDVESLVLTRQNGRAVYVRDVGEARHGFKKADTMVKSFGQMSIAINCQRETGANVLDVMDGVHAAAAELNAGVLAREGLFLKVVYDETDYIYSAIGLVNQSLVLGSVLTVIVLLIFLRSARSTLVIALAIPSSIIGAFLMLHLMGRSLNVVSLAGMAFAVGMLVDNAVVVLENVYRLHQSGVPAHEAAVRGTQEVWGAVLASTSTTLAVFVPILFLEDQAGQLFRDIALAISASVALSLIVSVTVISTATSRLLKGRRQTRDGGGVFGGLLRPVDALAGAFVRAITRQLAWFQASRTRQVAVLAVFIAAAVAGTAAMFPKVEYLPNGNRNLVFGILKPPPGYNLDELVAMGKRIEDQLQPYWDVDPGSPEAAQLDGPPIQDFFYVARGRSVFLGLRAQDPLRAAELVPMVQRGISGIPGTFAFASQSSLFEQGLSAGRTIDVEITGPELEGLVGYGLRTFMGVRESLPTSQAIPQPSLDLSNPEVHVIPRWDRAADLGVDAGALGYAVDALVDGAYATDYFVGGDKIDLTIIGRERFSNRTDLLEQMPIATPTGDLVPLGALAYVRLASGPEQINHRERERAVTIQVSPPPDVPLEEAMELIESDVIGPMVDGGQLEPGYAFNLAGTADKLRATWEAMRFNLTLALIITYLLMAALFESWLYPLVILLSVPLGAVGGFAGLELLNVFTLQPLDVLTMLGFVMLLGTVVNNAILIVHRSLQLVRGGEVSLDEAVLESVRTRIRPIFMTTTTTVCGLLPLVVSPGAGSELYRGIGSVLLGGLVVSTLFTLVLVPTLLHLVLSLRGGRA